jgi:hypothetical protein
LCSPAIIKNLISVRHFVIDNWCSIEFDPFGFTVKDLHTRTVIAKYNSSGPLYALHHALPAPPSSSPPAAYTATTTSGTLWHHRLGHLGSDALARLSTVILVSKDGSLACATPASLAATSAFLIPLPLLELLPISNFYIVICGHLQLLAFRVTNII